MTLTSKGQLTIPRQLRDANRCAEDFVYGLAPGARLQASIDSQSRLVLVPAVQRSMSLADIESAIAAAVDREDP